MNPPIRNIHAGTCKLGQRLFCDSEGILYPCEKANSKSLKIGDYNNGISYNNIDYIEKQWVDLLKFECSKCFAVRLCSLCYVHAIKANNFDINKMRINCANEKKSIRHFLYMYISIMEENPDALSFLRVISSSVR
jgi:uncharacterized protein